MADELPVNDCEFDTSVPNRIIGRPKTLSVFQKFSMDCSCGGKSLGYVCGQQGVDKKLVLKMLQRKITNPATGTRGEIDGDSPCESR